MNLYWPILLIIGSNLFYHLSAKAQPEGSNPLATLLVTYATGAMMALVLYFLTSPKGNLAAEYGSLNWAPIALGVAIVGLEFGSISMYKAGWNISTGPLLVSISLAVLFLLIGFVFFKEVLTPAKMVGIVFCILGLILIR